MRNAINFTNDVTGKIEKNVSNAINFINDVTQ